MCVNVDNGYGTGGIGVFVNQSWDVGVDELDRVLLFGQRIYGRNGCLDPIAIAIAIAGTAAADGLGTVELIFIFDLSPSANVVEALSSSGQ